MRAKCLLCAAFLSLSLGMTGRAEDSIEVEETYIEEEYLEYIEEITTEYGIQPELIISIIEHESRGNAGASNGGCKGLMQINEKYHKSRMSKLGVNDLYDPYGNILVGVDYIMEMSEIYEDVAAVLMHYHGESNVEKRLNEGKLSNYAESILSRSRDLELLHYGYGEGKSMTGKVTNVRQLDEDHITVTIQEVETQRIYEHVLDNTEIPKIDSYVSLYTTMTQLSNSNYGHKYPEGTIGVN